MKSCGLANQSQVVPAVPLGYMPINTHHLVPLVIYGYAPPKIFIFANATISQASPFANILPL